MTTQSTHETYLQRTRDAIVTRAIAREMIDESEAERLTHTKLVYGVGDGSYRGITAYQAWENGIGKVDVIEIAATGEESWIQLAGTTIHELGHVLAGHGSGHEKAWKEASERLGLRRPKAAGQQYTLAQIDPVIRETIHDLARELGDGRPEFGFTGSGAFGGLTLVVTPRPCSQGIGSRGGTSRGKGSGSRLRLYECTGCERPQKVRVSSDTFDATHNVCGTTFVLR